jgi:hypothetical protein
MSNSKVGALLEGVIANTKSGKMKWQESHLANRFDLNFPNSTISIQPTINNSGLFDEEGFRITIYNGSGTQIETFSDYDIKDEWAEKQRSSIQDLKELYEDARRQALGVDIVLDELINQLNR